MKIASFPVRWAKAENRSWSLGAELCYSVCEGLLKNMEKAPFSFMAFFLANSWSVTGAGKNPTNLLKCTGEGFVILTPHSESS